MKKNEYVRPTAIKVTLTATERLAGDACDNPGSVPDDCLTVAPTFVPDQPGS